MQEIEKAIRESDVFVIVISPSSLKSPWVERETILALDLDKPIIPILYKDAILPIHLNNLVQIDFRIGYSTYSHSFDELHNLLATNSYSTHKRKWSDGQGGRPLISQMPRWKHHLRQSIKTLISISIIVLTMTIVYSSIQVARGIPEGSEDEAIGSFLALVGIILGYVTRRRPWSFFVKIFIAGVLLAMFIDLLSGNW